MLSIVPKYSKTSLRKVILHRIQRPFLNILHDVKRECLENMYLHECFYHVIKEILPMEIEKGIAELETSSKFTHLLLSTLKYIN